MRVLVQVTAQKIAGSGEFGRSGFATVLGTYTVLQAMGYRSSHDRPRPSKICIFRTSDRIFGVS